MGYGTHSGDQFLFAFGFLPQDAPTDAIVAPLPPAQTTALVEIRDRLFGIDQPPCLRKDAGAYKDLLAAMDEELQMLYEAPDPATRSSSLVHLLRFLEDWEMELAYKLNRFPFINLWRLGVRSLPADLHE